MANYYGTLTRENAKKMIKMMSFWKIDKRSGNYQLPEGAWLTDYLTGLVNEALTLNGMGIGNDGNIYSRNGNSLFVPFGADEPTTDDEQIDRAKALVAELVF